MAKQRARGGNSSNLKIVAAVLMAVVVAGIVFGSSLGGESTSDDAKPGQGPRIVPAMAYRVTYRTNSMAGGESIITTEDLAMRRPFESHIFEYKGSGSAKKLVTERTTSYGLSRTTGGRQPQVVATIPGTPPFDMRLDSVLDDLIRRGAVVPGKQKTVNGHRCTIVKTMDPIVGAKPAPPNPNGDHAENCIDRHGVVIQERWWLANKLTRTRLAVKLDYSPTFAPDEFAIREKPLDLASGGTVLKPVEGLSTGSFTVDPPAGFRLRDTFQYYVPRGSQSGVTIPLVHEVQVWVKGIDYITLEQGEEASGSGLPASMGSISVPNLTDVGVASTILGSEVFGHTGPGQLLHLESTLSPERLLAVARTLHK